MASFKSEQAPRGWHPKVGDLVTGEGGGVRYLGRVLPAQSNPRRPAVFSRGGFVGVYVMCGHGDRAKERVLVEVRPA